MPPYRLAQRAVRRKLDGDAQPERRDAGCEQDSVLTPDAARVQCTEYGDGSDERTRVREYRARTTQRQRAARIGVCRIGAESACITADERAANVARKEKN